MNAISKPSSSSRCFPRIGIDLACTMLPNRKTRPANISRPEIKANKELTISNSLLKLHTLYEALHKLKQTILRKGHLPSRMTRVHDSMCTGLQVLASYNKKAAPPAPLRNSSEDCSSLRKREAIFRWQTTVPSFLWAANAASHS